MNSERVVFYIDGFNLYFGLKERGWRKYYWLNLEEMCRRLIRPHQEIKKIQYVTALLNQANEDKRLRQKVYLEALETLPLVGIYYGTYLSSPQTCFKCGYTFIRHSEKKSDVNIAVKMITDGLDDLYDSAVLISADSDLSPSIEAIRKYFPTKRVILFFPPKRSSLSLEKICHAYGGVLNRTTVSKSQFPETVISKTGFPLTRPDHWK